MTERAALEARIADDAEDDEAYAVYADVLQAQGDPRGELIALMLAREAEEARGVARSPVATAIAKHLQRYSAAWRAQLTVAPDQAFVWRRGFLHRATLEELDADLLDPLLADPSARFLRGLAVRCDDVAAGQRAVDAIAARGLPLAELELTVRGKDTLDLGGLWPSGLRRLGVTAWLFDLGPLHAERLERLRLSRATLPGVQVQLVAAAPWPRLERLELRFAGAGQPNAASLADVLRLVRRDDLPALTHLRLRGCEHAGEALVALAEAPLGRQLQVIDLSFGFVEAAELRALAAHRASFPALRELWLPASAWQAASRALEGIARHVVSDARAPKDSFDADVR